MVEQLLVGDGVGTVDAAASTATVEPPAASVPRWAAWSMP
jgi:hypothetical protein